MFHDESIELYPPAHCLIHFLLQCKLYRGVIEDVVNGVREAFLDEGVDEAVLLELKQIWENKLAASKAIDPLTDPAEASLQNKVAQSELDDILNQNEEKQPIHLHVSFWTLAQQSSTASASGATNQPASSGKQPVSGKSSKCMVGQKF